MRIECGPDGMFAGWIETARGPAFACYHPPAGAVRDVAVLVCDPFGSDRMNLHLCQRALALELAASGFPVLRVDYWGTCDSGGDPREPGQVDAWLATLHEAADWLLRTSSCSGLGCFGARLGGTIAAAFAAQRSDVRSLALWDPHPDGAAFLRELRAFRALRGEPSAPARPSDWQPGDQEAIGFLLTRETADAIAALDVRLLATGSVRQALILNHANDTSEGIAAALGARGIAVARRVNPGFDTTRLVEEFTRPPEGWLEELAGWWREAHPATRRAPAIAAPPQLAPCVALRNRRGREVREEWVRFGPDGALVGIVTRPLFAADGGAGIVLVNGGFNHRPGINRNYVDWARSWAERGATVLRMDIRGLGDSIPERPEDLAHLYRQETRADVEAGVDLLVTRYGVAELICGGLCAGAAQALAAARVDQRITGAFLLNPLRFDLGHDEHSRERADLGDPALRHYARSTLDLQRWRRLWTGEARGGRIARSVASRLARMMRASMRRLVARARGNASPPATPLAACFRALDERGCRVLVVFDSAEAIRHRVEDDLAHDRALLDAGGRFRLCVIDDADHIFLSLASQEALGGVLERWLFDRARARPALQGAGLDPLG